MDGFGDPAKLVGEAGQTFADELEQPLMDRPWFCSAYAAAGYFMCDPLTNVPKWCEWNMSDIYCPNDAGYEYDPVTGGGGDSGGAGAGRTFDVQKCMDSDFKTIPCQTGNKTMCTVSYLKTSIEWGGFVLEERTDSVLCSSLDKVVCVDQDGIRISCDKGTLENKPYQIYFDAPNYKGCINSPIWYGGDQGYKMDKSADCPPIQKHVDKTKPPTYDYDIGKGLIFNDPITGMPLNNEKIENGVPIAVAPVPIPPNPFEPVVPETTEECASIICQCIAAVVRALSVVNASVLKVDDSVLKVVSAVTNYKSPLPEPLHFKPVTDELQRILKAIDDVTVEMVKEAGTNFWDVLGGAFGDIFDLVEFLIEKIIYLVIPEDSSSIINAFDLLRADLMSKVSPIHEIQQHITSSIPSEQKEFENIAISLPRYGEVTFFKTDYLLQAIPFIRQLLSAIMVILTAIWAYRKVSSEMIK